MKKFLLFTFLAYGTFFSFTVFAAATPAKVIIDTSLPGPYNVAVTGPVGAIGNIYYFAMALGGFLAFASIVYAGIKWTASRGNSSTISDAKDQITQAMIGLLLLVGSFIVLNTVNPQLTILKFPELTKIEISSGPAVSTIRYACKVEGAVVGDSCYATDTCDGACPGIDPRATCEQAVSCSADKCDFKTLAEKNSTAFPAKNSPELQAMMGCIQGIVGSTPGSKFTYDIDHPSCNYTRGAPGCEASAKCSHARNSCHYGGSSGSDGALAVDYGGAGKTGQDKTNYFNGIIAAANRCGAKSGGARCEDQNGISQSDCSQASHVHVSAAGCDRN